MAVEVSRSGLPTSEDIKYYRWTFPGAPITIDIALAVVGEINARLDAAPDEDIGRFAGVLTGLAQRGLHGPSHVKIDGFIAIPFDSETRFKQRLLEFTARQESSDAPGPAGSLVGYFRVQSDELRMNDEGDILNIQAIPNLDVVLMIAGRHSGERTAGIRFREGDDFMPSLMDFPFDTAALWAEEMDRRHRGMTRRTAEARGPLGPPVEPESAHIDDAAAVMKNAAAPNGSRPRKERLVLATGLIALIVSVLTASTVFLLRKTARPDAGAPPAGSQLDSAAELRLDAQANGLTIAWSPTALAVKNAVSGRILVTEENQAQRAIELDVPLLRNGRMFYVPSSSHVRICLELNDPSSRVTNICTLALLSAVAEPAAAPLLHPRAPGAGGRPTNEPAASAAPGTTQPGPKFRVESQTPVVSPRVSEPTQQLPARPFLAPEKTTSRPASDAPVVVDPPASVAQSDTSRVVSSPVPGSWSNVTAAPPPPASPPDTPKPSAPEPAQAAVNPVRATSLIGYKAPVATFESMPRLDPALRGMLFGEPEIEIKVQIDRTGRVVGAQVVSGSKQMAGALETAAMAAAKRWVFIPAQANGTAIRSEHLIQFKFRK